MRTSRLVPQEEESIWRNTFADDFEESMKKAEQWTLAKGPQREKTQKYLLRHMKRAHWL